MCYNIALRTSDNMDINDKLLYEIYFRYENLSAEEGDF